MTPDPGQPQPSATATADTPAPAAAPSAPPQKEESVPAIVATTAFFALLLTVPFLVWISGSAESVGGWVGTLVVTAAVGLAGLIGCIITLMLHLKPTGTPIRWEARWTPALWAAFAPPAAFAFVILLATRGLLPLVAVWVLTLAPSAFLAWRARRAGPASVAAPGQGLAVTMGLALVPVFFVLHVLAMTGLDVEAQRPVEKPTFAAFLGRYESVVRHRPQLRAPVDPSIDPVEAGEALHALARMGTAQPVLPEKQPLRRYPEVWVTDDGSTVGAIPRDWARKLIPLAARGLTPAQTEYLRNVARHPAHADYSMLARAGTVDVITTTFALPIGRQFQAGSLPIIPRKPVVDGSHAHVAAAALDLAEGRVAEAEAKLKEVYTVGLILMEESPLLVDGGIGLLIAEEGRDGLRELYRATGRTAELAALEQPDVPASRFASVTAFPAPDDAKSPRPMRWQALANATLDECWSLRGVVFGPGPARAEAMAKARAGLAHTPGETAWIGLMDETPSRMARAKGSQLEGMQRLSRRVFGDGASTGCPRAIKLDAIAD